MVCQRSIRVTRLPIVTRVRNTWGKVTTVDCNGDGKPWALVGYSERQNKVIQYETRLVVTNPKKERSVTTEHWTDYLFSKKRTNPGSWKYEIDYRGRGGLLARYETHYDKHAERFEGRLVTTGGE